MKKLIYLSLLFIGFSFTPTAQAQINVNINIGNQPLWGPAGYEFARFYYIPEIDVYYNVANRKYTYFHGNRWVTKSKLPSRYRNFDIYRTYKVVINDDSPWRFHERNRRSYGRYANNRSQVIIRDARKKAQHMNHHRDHRNYERDRGPKGRPHKENKHHDRRHGRD